LAERAGRLAKIRKIQGKPYWGMSEAEKDALAEKQLQQHLSGKKEAHLFVRTTIPMIDISNLRQQLGLSQNMFARRFGFSVRSVQNWEQKRRLPDRSALILLNLIERDPVTVARIASEI
jgi:putative transcriptional regulator